MTNNWPTFFQQNIQPPETIAEAVDRLMMILNDEQKIALTVMRESELINLHFSLGMAIRNAFGLHEPGSKLLASCNNASHPGILYNASHPDDVSGMIINKLWTRLNYGD